MRWQNTSHPIGGTGPQAVPQRRECKTARLDLGQHADAGQGAQQSVERRRICLDERRQFVSTFWSIGEVISQTELRGNRDDPRDAMTKNQPTQSQDGWNSSRILNLVLRSLHIMCHRPSPFLATVVQGKVLSRLS